MAHFLYHLVLDLLYHPVLDSCSSDHFSTCVVLMSVPLIILAGHQEDYMPCKAAACGFKFSMLG